MIKKEPLPPSQDFDWWDAFTKKDYKLAGVEEPNPDPTLEERVTQLENKIESLEESIANLTKFMNIVIDNFINLSDKMDTEL